MENLIEKTFPNEGCTVDNFLSGDNDLPVCVEKDNDKWDSTFFEQLRHDDQEDEDKDIDGHEIEIIDQKFLPKLKSYKEAINALEDVSRFLESRRHVEESIRISSTIDNL